jgi:hypothetical protein
VHVTPDGQLWSPAQEMSQVPAPEQVTGPWHDMSLGQETLHVIPAGHVVLHATAPPAQVKVHVLPAPHVPPAAVHRMQDEMQAPLEQTSPAGHCELFVHVWHEPETQTSGDVHSEPTVHAPHAPRTHA